MDPGSVYAPLSADAFACAGIERKTLADDFLNHFLASKVAANKKKEIEDNLNTYSPFNDADNRCDRAYGIFMASHVVMYVFFFASRDYFKSLLMGLLQT